jgi:hypothetical protein
MGTFWENEPQPPVTVERVRKFLWGCAAVTAVSFVVVVVATW